MTEENKLMTMANNMAPSYIGDSLEGTEDISRQDLQVPSLKLAQAMSPEVTEGDAKFIPELRPGNFFNTVTKEIYGKAIQRVAILRADPPRYVEFIPRSEGGGVKDPNVPANDPRTQFRTDPATGKPLPPIATKYYDYVIVNLDTMEPIQMSLKGMALKSAKNLNAMIKLSGKAIYAKVYRVMSIGDKNSKGPFHNWSFIPNGWVGENEYLVLKEMFASFKDRVIEHTDLEEEEHDSVDPGDGDTSFDTSTM